MTSRTSAPTGFNTAAGHHRWHQRGFIEGFVIVNMVETLAAIWLLGKHYSCQRVLEAAREVTPDAINRGSLVHDTTSTSLSPRYQHSRRPLWGDLQACLQCVTGEGHSES